MKRFVFLSLFALAAAAAGCAQEFDVDARVFSAWPTGTSAGQTGQIRLQELRANGSDYVAWRVPDSLAAPVAFTPPNALPPATRCLEMTVGGLIQYASTVCGGGGGSASGPSGALQFSDGAGGFIDDDAALHFDAVLNRLGPSTDIPFLFGVNGVIRGEFLAGSPGGFRVEDGTALLQMIPDLLAGFRTINSDLGNVIQVNSLSTLVGFAGQIAVRLGSPDFNWDDSGKLLTVTGDATFKDGTATVTIDPNLLGGTRSISTDFGNIAFQSSGATILGVATKVVQLGSAAFNWDDSAALLTLDGSGTEVRWANVGTGETAIDINDGLIPAGLGGKINVIGGRAQTAAIRLKAAAGTDTGVTMFDALDVTGALGFFVSGAALPGSSFAPTNIWELTRKDYVDAQIAGQGFIDFSDLSASLPLTYSGAGVYGCSTCVTANTVQSITASKTFTTDQTFNGIIFGGTLANTGGNLLLSASDDLNISSGAGIGDDVTILGTNIVLGAADDVTISTGPGADDDIILNAGGTNGDIVANDLVLANAGVDAPASGVNALSFSLQVSGSPSTVLSVSGTATRANFSEYIVGGTAGISLTCAGGNVVQNAVFVKGILTGGTCAAN